MLRRTFLGTGVALAGKLGISTTAPMAAAAPLRPTGPVILTVRGRITHTNSERGLELDRAMLVDLGLAEITTWTPFTEGEAAFRGVRLRTLLDAVGSQGTTLWLVALNDYSISVPVTDAEQFSAMLALQQDGRDLRVRDRGPIWLIYPWNRMNADDEVRTRPRSVWQIKEIVVE